MIDHPSAAGQPRWQVWIETYMSRFQEPGLSVGKMIKLWAVSFTIVMIACAVFFLPLVWLFG